MEALSTHSVEIVSFVTVGIAVVAICVAVAAWLRADLLDQPERKRMKLSSLACFAIFLAIGVFWVNLGTYYQDIERRQVTTDVEASTDIRVHRVDLDSDTVEVEPITGCIYRAAYVQLPDGRYVLVEGSGVLEKAVPQIRGNEAYQPDCPARM